MDHLSPVPAGRGPVHVPARKELNPIHSRRHDSERLRSARVQAGNEGHRDARFRAVRRMEGPNLQTRPSKRYQRRSPDHLVSPRAEEVAVDSLAAPCLDHEGSIAVDLTGILEANDAALLTSALGDIARARGMTEIAKQPGSPVKLSTRLFARAALRASIMSRASPAPGEFRLEFDT